MSQASFRFPQPAEALRIDGERYVSNLLGDPTWGDIQSEHYHRYLFALQFCAGKDILDVASGEGYGSHCLSQVAHSVTGVDASDEAVAFANRNYKRDNVFFKVGKAQALPIGDASVDVVVSYETLEHFTEHDAFAAEARRVLRPGGILLISSPNRPVYTDQANHHNEWHLRELDRGEFLSYLSTNFAHVRLFAQRPIVGSVIASDDKQNVGGIESFISIGNHAFERCEGVPQPPFFIALASDVRLPETGPSLLQNPALMLHVDAQRRHAIARMADLEAKVADLETALANARNGHGQLRGDTGKVEAEQSRSAANFVPAAESTKPSPAPPVATLPGGVHRPSPSDLMRLRNATWVEPEKRPDFIQMRAIQPRAKIAVVAHVYYADLWPQMAEKIRNIPEAFDLFVTLVSGVTDSFAPTIHEQFPAAHVLVLDNHGRDIFPFLTLVRTGILFKYELLCKIHSKRSPYFEGGDEWRRRLLDGILGSADLVQSVLSAFRSDVDLGIVVADGQLFGGRDRWISNEARLRELFRDIGMNASAFEREFVGGSMYWIRPFILRSIDALCLSFDDFEPEPIANDGCTVHAVERLVSLACYDAGMRAIESGALPLLRANSPAPKVHVIANYLPQFHPVPENNLWWGEGFTEWSNVTKAVPLFRGHRQPQLPTDLGFCDLRVPETRMAQAALAQRYGITAFSYYYYWFNGRQLLNRPLDEIMASSEPDFPFMLCWANEPWSRNWDGLPKEVLMPQEYAPDWQRSFASDVARLMRDRRYLRLNGKPMLAIYRVGNLPETAAAIADLRHAFKEEGFSEIHLVGGWLQIGEDGPLPLDARDLGLDAYFEFPPHGIPARALDLPPSDRVPGFTASVLDYSATVDSVLAQLATGQAAFRHRGVMMGWDNTARRGTKACIFHGATPTNFRRWLRGTVQAARSEARGSENALFINAWNEWAEGTHLEPDRHFGTGWLEAVASATADGLQFCQDRKSLQTSRSEADKALDALVTRDLKQPATMGRYAPADPSNHNRAAAATSVQLFQIAYSASTLAAIEPGYLPLDNVANERPDWREYWPIRRFLLQTDLDHNVFYGFFSTKFGAKTLLSHSQVRSFVEENARGADVMLFSPQPDMGAFYLNVFEQGETFDPGFIDASNAFLAHIGHPLQVGNLIMDSRQVSFSNYFVAKPSFWRDWLAINEALFAICEGPDSWLKQLFCQATTYPDAVQRKVFFQERVASLMLATQPQWRSVSYNPFGMAWSMSRFRDHAVDAITSDALKMAFRDRNFPQYMAAFKAVRDRFIAAGSGSAGTHMGTR